MIYWLLNSFVDGQGKYTLLNHLIKKLQLDIDDKSPIRINTEEPAKSRSVDIYIEWKKFILIIENKIYSTELENQCSDYLKYFMNNDEKKEVKLIYLTRLGNKPNSIKEKERKNIISLSYSQLIVYFDEFGKNYGKVDQNYIVLIDYIKTCNRILGKGIKNMDKLEVKASSKLIFSHFNELYDDREKPGQNDMNIFRQALEDTDNIIEYIKTQIFDILKQHGDFFEVEIKNKKHFLWTKKEWIINKDKMLFHFGFRYEAGSEKKLFPYYPHPIGLHVKTKDEYVSNGDVRIKPLVKNLVANIQNLLNENLEDKIIEEYKNTNDYELGNGTKHWILCYKKNTNLFSKAEYDVSRWIEELISEFKKISEVLIPIIDKKENIKLIKQL